MQNQHEIQKQEDINPFLTYFCQFCIAKLFQDRLPINNSILKKEKKKSNPDYSSVLLSMLYSLSQFKTQVDIVLKKIALLATNEYHYQTNGFNKSQFQKHYQEFLSNLKVEFIELEKVTKIHDLLEFQDKLQEKFDQKDKQQPIPLNQNDFMLDDKFKDDGQRIYCLDSFVQMKQSEVCSAFAFNENSSQLFVGINSMIKVYDFQQENLETELQVLNGHSNSILNLHYLKIRNQLVSNGMDKVIIVWNQEKNLSWVIQKKFKGIKGIIYTMISTLQEETLVTGGKDKIIKFWNLQGQSEISKFFITTTFVITSLSLNESEQKLIACGYQSKFILVFDKTIYDEWKISQKIDTQKYGNHLCFINDKEFTFRQYHQSLLEIFKQNSQTKLFQKFKEFEINTNDNLLIQPFCYFLSKQKLLIIKDSNSVNILSNSNDDNFILQQSIKFDCGYIYGKLSDDGKYLIFWNDSSKQIQIRKRSEEQSII